MIADDIPADITKLTYTAPGPTMSQNEAAEVLAHYWDAIRRHVLSREGYVLGCSNPDRSPEWSEGIDWAVEHLRQRAEMTGAR